MGRAAAPKDRPCGARRYRVTGDADLCRQAVGILEAGELVELGARAGLITRVTGLEKKTVNRLYRQLRGAPSPSGQAPFTDAWFLESELRMLHASIIWRLHKRLEGSGRGPARLLIDVYTSYLRLVADPLLDLTHAAFVPRLLTMNVWEERACGYCRGAYLAPIVENDNECPGCRLYHRYRCRVCGGQIEAHAKGRRRRTCGRCQNRLTTRRLADWP